VPNMAEGGLRSWVARRFDDYVEDTVVGRRAWVILLLFALGMAILTALVDVVVPSLYRPGNVAISLVIGSVVGGALLLVARERERYRAASIDHTGDIAALRKKPWGEFEILVGQAIRNQGYVIKERGGFKRDHGVDLIAERGRERVLIQCKHWTAWNVGEGIVKQLYADTRTQGFTAGWLVTCGRFTEFAKSWAVGKELRLIDGEELVQLIAPPTRTASPIVTVGSQMPAALAAPSCPNCGLPLHRMTNRYDQSTFWGCVNAKCNWTIDDAASGVEAPKCGHGHAMTMRQSSTGVEYWHCTNPTCSRKRLRSPNVV
jgi:HJR/Mrr/RecB family endonuclease